MTDDVAVMKASVERLVRENRLLRLQLKRDRETAVGPCPVCAAHRARVKRYSQSYREKRKERLAHPGVAAIESEGLPEAESSRGC